ncbi:hypothetical protein [uncultured Methanoregula sp.]|uniref:hypothetical protein n=1 Tax=uncultured Methanoregula sp. TaxID=1005933 RepID=UPI002AAAEA12|nr:hypothetical protein [uncultured Methanoregula sp.]
MKMLRTPLPHAHLSRLERCGSAELLALFNTCLKTGQKTTPYDLLPDAWSRLFSGIFLSAEELVDEMPREERRFSNDHERMLREFIKADCAGGGTFVIEVIKNGGKIDRAALIMIADLEDLAGIEHNGIMAIQLLVEACDKKVRPALIRKAGKRLLSQVYDHRGLPIIFSIFGLCDLTAEDLDAIDSVFSRDELKNVMSRNRTGNNALVVFMNLAASMKRYPRMERNALVRNAFYIPAAKDTKKEECDKPVRIKKISGMPAEDTKQ